MKINYFKMPINNLYKQLKYLYSKTDLVTTTIALGALTSLKNYIPTPVLLTPLAINGINKVVSLYKNYKRQNEKILDTNKQFNLIPFNQFDIMKNMDILKHPKLCALNKKFNGLCEFICNQILIDDLLGKGTTDGFLKEKISVDTLNTNIIQQSHILDVYKIYHLIIAFLFGIYPDNIFSFYDQWNLTITTVKKIYKDLRQQGYCKIKLRTVNKKLLEKGLKQIDAGEVLKLQIIRKFGFSFGGHSLLVKKVSDTKYIFFDPNRGEYRNLSFEDLLTNIDRFLDLETDIFLSRGKDYLQRLRNKKIL